MLPLVDDLDAASFIQLLLILRSSVYDALFSCSSVALDLESGECLELDGSLANVMHIMFSCFVVLDREASLVCRNGTVGV
jgi:hypothetical protein